MEELEENGAQIKKILTERRMGEWEWSTKWDAEGRCGAFCSTGGAKINSKYIPKPTRGPPEC